MPFHYTDKAGYDAIRSQPVWRFKAAQPPADHPFGAYFTPLPPGSPYLAARLGLPARKVEYFFEFEGDDGLEPYDGGRGRGRYIIYSRADYLVPNHRWVRCGPSSTYEAVKS